MPVTVAAAVSPGQRDARVSRRAGGANRPAVEDARRAVAPTGRPKPSVVGLCNTRRV